MIATVSRSQSGVRSAPRRQAQTPLVRFATEIDLPQHLEQAESAGCDLVLVCPPALVEESLRAMPADAKVNPEVVRALQGRSAGSDSALADARSQAAKQRLTTLNETQGSLA